MVSMRKTLCNSLVQCHFDYSSSSWFCGLTKQLKNRLQVTQNKVVRFIHGVSCRTSLSVKDFKELGMLDVENRCRQNRLNHAHKIFNGGCPKYLRENFVKTSDVHNYNDKNNFFVPHANGFTLNTFYYNCIKDWNQLPENIKCVKSKYKFKRLVKTHLLEKMMLTENSDYIWF